MNDCSEPTGHRAQKSIGKRARSSASSATINPGVKPTRLALAVSLALVALAPQWAQAGPGKVCLDGVTPLTAASPTCAAGTVGTYYANSPPLRKFVDTLAGLTSAGANKFDKNFTGEYIAIAEPDLASYPGSEYFVIGVVEHDQRMHSDLAKETTQRSYVQLYPSKADGGAYDASGKPVVAAASAYAGFGAPPPGQPVALTYPDSTDSSGKITKGKAITWPDGTQVYGYDKAHYLGPIVITAKGTPVRIKFVNFLPNGSATITTTTSGGVTTKTVTARNGDMFLPTDESLAGAGLSSDNTNKYPQNRVAFHLHGGDSPWISDGTPHQWIAASGENSLHQHGDRFMNTPDMPYPGDGAQTTFWPNDQSSRLMWYHDHTFGLTRQNAYSGAAAGYVIYDAAEVALIYGGTLGSGANAVTINKAIPNTLLDQIVLVVQDKGFVPDDIAVQDSKWDEKAWGTKGDLWYPHVYEPFQIWDKGGNLGVTVPGQLLPAATAPAFINPAGRWDYAVDDATLGYRVPNSPTRNDPDYGNVAFPDGTYFGGPSATPESYMDTPVVNGIAYPVLKVDPKAYRVRFLNGANDRYWNLSLWVADDTPAVVAAAGRPGTEVKMVPADGTATFKLAGGKTYSPDDLRPGGVPDPATAGPNIIRFANEGGLLQQPVVHAPSPMNGYNDPLAGFTLARDAGANFYLGGAERADTVIDFSQYAGKTLILYNDSSAPVPGGDSRYDYYTGDPDQTTSGGAPTTLPGYGPNTRTVMQIVVAPLAAGATVTAYDPLGTGGALATELPKAYAASADAHIVASGTVPTAVSASTSSMTLNGATVPLKVKTIQGFTDPNFGRLIAQIGTELQNDPLTGAANTTNAATPLGYVDTPTDIISDGETQYWWIKNNDVDNHPMHFHLFNVQVVARVDHFNNALIYAPQPDETGWKETVKNWPLEDVIVAVMPKTPALPFGLPKSVRNLDPTLPANAPNSSFNRPGADLVSAFFQNDVVTGLPIKNASGATVPVVNSSYDFDWEYVWHCHILGHEENDLMRPLVFHPAPPSLPTTPPGSVAVTTAGLVTWTDPTPATGARGNTANEIGFRVERVALNNNSSVVPVFGALTPTSPVVDGRVNTLANATSFKDAPAAFTDYRYQVVAVNEAGDVKSSTTAMLSQPPAAPTGLTAAASVGTTVAATATKPATTGWNVKLNWTDAATNETGYVVQRATGTINPRTGVPTWSAFASKPAATSVLAANLASFVDGPVGVTAQTLYKYQV
ncbi:MAG: multicopper oxidase domain-containing protein, partial [Comamonadaceae bacterium]